MLAAALVFLRLFLSFTIILEVTKTMKKIIALLLALLMAVGMLAGCGKQKDDDTTYLREPLRVPFQAQLQYLQ